MSTLGAIELNDAGVSLAVANRILFESPGFALLDPLRPLVGAAAYERSSIEPRLVNSRFWQDLGPAPLARPVPGAATLTDLARLHLSHVWSEAGSDLEEVILAVPGRFSQAQLGLLLGIAAELKIPVVGLVDTALAMSREPYPGSNLLHLDIHLHAAVLTVLAQGERLQVMATRSLDDCGLLSLHERWTRSIAAQFVRETRFDPLHRAESEQTLRSSLPGWLQALSSNDNVTAALPGTDGRVHEVSLSGRRLSADAQDLYARIERLVDANRGAGAVVLQTSHRLADLVGLRERFSTDPGLRMVPLPRGAAAIGALRRSEHIKGAEPNTLTASLPWMPPPRLTPPVTPHPTEMTPTHVVYRGVAHRLSNGILTIGTDVRDERASLIVGARPDVCAEHCHIHVQTRRVTVEACEGRVIRVNGKVVSASRLLQAGDSIRLGEATETIEMIVEAHREET